MKYHPSGKHDHLVSEVGFGAMGISDFYAFSAKRDDTEDVATIHAAQMIAF